MWVLEINPYTFLQRLLGVTRTWASCSVLGGGSVTGKEKQTVGLQRRLWQESNCLVTQKWQKGPTVGSDMSPPRDPALVAKGTALCCQAHGSDEVGDCDRRGQLQQRDVIGKYQFQVQWMSDDLHHTSGDLIEAGIVQGDAAEANFD